MKPKKIKRRVTVRFTQEEYNELVRRARLDGMSISRYIRSELYLMSIELYDPDMYTN